MDYKKKNKKLINGNNYYDKTEKKLINSNNNLNSIKEDNNRDQEIESLKGIIKKLKSKNFKLIEENKYLKLQIKELKSEKRHSNNSINFYPRGKNCIFAEYIITEDDVNKNVRILNHDEEIEIENFDDSYGPNYYTEGTDNQEEIEESCMIYFGNKPIKFTETFNFFKKGKFSFTFEFKYKLTNISHLFKDCHNLLSVDFSRFDSSQLQEIDSLFENCYNLKYIDFSKFYSSVLKEAKNVFYGINNKCRLICKEKCLLDKFEDDKFNYQNKDDYENNYYYDD